MSTFSGILSGVGDVQLSHRIEKGDGSYAKYTYLFVAAVDPTGVEDKRDRDFGLSLWGKPQQVGLAVFQFEGRTKMRVRDVRLLPTYQKQGLGIRMYRYAQEVTGRQVLPSKDQTTAGKALWRHIKRTRALSGLRGFNEERRKYHLTGDKPEGWSGQFISRADLTTFEMVAYDELLEQGAGLQGTFASLLSGGQR